MTDKISALLQTAAGATVPVIRGITDDQLGEPTPCSEYDVHDLVDHLFQVIINFQLLGAKQDSDFSAPPERLEGSWRDRYAEETARLVATWAAPGAEEGTTGAMAMPARTVGTMALGDLTLHGWDLARATGQPYEADPAVVETLSAEYRVLAPQAHAMGMMAAPVAVPGDATPFERLLGLSGRDPRWTGAYRATAGPSVVPGSPTP